MNELATRNRGGWGGYRERATPAMREEARSLIGKLQQKGWSRAAIARAVGYRNDMTISNIVNKRSGISKEKLQKLRQLNEDTTVAPVTTKRNVSLLYTLDEIHCELEAIVSKIEQAIPCAIPLLQTGMRELIADIRKLQEKVRV